MGEQFVNIAGYRFVDLPDRDDLRKPLQELCATLELKGTILLSTEGINFFLAASEPNVSKFISELEKDERFVGITLKRSFTDYQPFNRMNVRLKKEIISVGMDEIQPARFTGEDITPTEFKKWLDEGREIAVLDARNGYELRVGTFENAIIVEIFEMSTILLSKCPHFGRFHKILEFDRGFVQRLGPVRSQPPVSYRRRPRESS